MSNFIKFKEVIQQQFCLMSIHQLFRTSIDKNVLWETYIESFPEGTNPIFRERTEHDCQCCKQFIRVAGSVVALINNTVVSLWDIDIGGHYQVVADALSVLVKSHKIDNIFLHTEKNIGTDKNRELSDKGDVVGTWNHFYHELLPRFVESGSNIGTVLSDKQSAKDVFKRGLGEITIESIKTVIELIDQNSIYRGQEHKESVVKFLKEKNAFDKLDTEEGKDIFSWSSSVSIGGLSRLRNSVVGTLLVDLSEGVGLDLAVKSFELKVAPANYKRPTALITKGMIEQAQKKVEELGIADSLARRFATVEDVTINNVLFVDRIARKEMNVFDEMSQEVNIKVDSFDRIEEIGIGDFIENVLPNSESIEILLENSHASNFVSLIAPQDIHAIPIFKWDNNYSWSYKGEVTDSIKARVKKAGGNVSGVLRCSLSWFNYDDLDIHLIEPNGNHIQFGNKGIVHPSSGKLDVDMNVPDKESRTAVENITWTNKSKIQEGKYLLFIHNFTPRENIDVGFDVEMEYDGEIHAFNYAKKVKGNVTVAEFKFDRKTGIKFIKSLPCSKSSKEVWALHTNQFQTVQMVINSPNYWEDNKTGNKHWFFILRDCKNPSQANGFFNEFLRSDLTPHRKVFEVMSAKMKAEISDNQLSGLGFSSTQRNHLICKVSGSFSRTIKINF